MATFTYFINTHSSNTPGGDGTTNAITGANRAFASMTEAEAAVGGVHGAGNNVIFECTSGDGSADTAAVAVSGWTEDDLTVRSNASDTVNGRNTTPKYSTDHYRLERNATGRCFLVQQAMPVYVDHIQMRSLAGGPAEICSMTSSVGRVHGCHVWNESTSGTNSLTYSALVEISANCFCNQASATNARAINVNGSTNRIVSNIMSGYDGASGDGIRVNGSHTITYLEDNTFYNNTEDLQLGSGTITNTNTNAADADINGDTSTIHPDWTAGVDYVDGPNDDWRTQSGGATANAGTATVKPATDITGAAFANDNVSAFNEIVGAGPAPSGYSYGYFVG